MHKLFKVGLGLLLLFVFLLGLNIGHERSVAQASISPFAKFMAANVSVAKADSQVAALQKEIAALREIVPTKKTGLSMGLLVLCFESRTRCRKLLDSVSVFQKMPLYVVQENNVASSVLQAEKPILFNHVRRQPRLRFAITDGEDKGYIFFCLLREPKRFEIALFHVRPVLVCIRVAIH
jgi:hypothetical protein